MADFTAHVSADQIVSEVRDDEEEFGELIALIAAAVGRLVGDEREALRDYVASYGERKELSGLAGFLTAAAAEAR